MNNHQKAESHTNFPAIVAGDGMKKSPSELALEALLRPLNGVVSISNSNRLSSSAVVGDSGAGDGILGFGDPTTAADELAFGYKNQEIMSGFSTCGGIGETPSWYQSIIPQQPCLSATIDSQSSICAGSPTSTLKPKTGDTQASGSSEDEEAEIEAGPCEQSNNPDNKRIRRMVSNRESARRSRRRKQAHLQDLEIQVEQLNGEHVTLYKQLTQATQQLKDASTNNRVLKSDVEALRAKVKLAEEMVARGSLSCSLNHLLQTHLGSVPQMLNTQTLTAMANMPPTIAVQGQNGSFGGSFSGIGGENVDHMLSGNARSTGLASETVSSVSEIWP